MSKTLAYSARSTAESQRQSPRHCRMVKHARCYLLCSLYKSFKGRWGHPAVTLAMTLCTVSSQRVILLHRDHDAVDCLKTESPRSSEQTRYRASSELDQARQPKRRIYTTPNARFPLCPSCFCSFTLDFISYIPFHTRSTTFKQFLHSRCLPTPRNTPTRLSLERLERHLWLRSALVPQRLLC